MTRPAPGRKAGKHVHKWRRLTAAELKTGFYCTARECTDKAVWLCVCMDGRCANHGHKPKRCEPAKFTRWSVRDGLLAFDGRIFDDEDAWKLAARAIVRALNAAHVVLPAKRERKEKR